MAVRRLQKEYSDILKKPEKGISAQPRVKHELFPVWVAWIHGPENTPYEGGIFQLEFVFRGDYPFKPPKVEFVTKILHCNIDQLGRLNLDILKRDWSPALTVCKVLLCVQSLLKEPNPSDPLEVDLGRFLRDNPEEYYKRVREATLAFATPQVNSEKNEDT